MSGNRLSVCLPDSLKFNLSYPYNGGSLRNRSSSLFEGDSGRAAQHPSAQDVLYHSLWESVQANPGSSGLGVLSSDQGFRLSAVQGAVKPLIARMNADKAGQCEVQNGHVVAQLLFGAGQFRGYKAHCLRLRWAAARTARVRAVVAVSTPPLSQFQVRGGGEMPGFQVFWLELEGSRAVLWIRCAR